MSFIDTALSTLAEKGDELIKGEGSDWADKLIEGGRENKGEVVSLVSGILPGAEEITGDAVDDVLDILEANKDPFVNLTSVAFTQLVGFFHSNDEEAAHNHYIATKASYEERRKWMLDGADLAAKARDERDKAWEDVKDVLGQIGEVGLKIVIAAAKLLIGI